MGVRGAMLFVPFEMVKLRPRVVLVRKSVMLWKRAAALGFVSGGNGSAPSPEMSSTTCRKLPPMGVLGCGESMMMRPGVKMRPLMVVNALELLVSLLLYRPIICALARLERRHAVMSHIVVTDSVPWQSEMMRKTLDVEAYIWDTSVY